MISVIVPVYNVENYISGCITSLINQTYQDYELIIVNDGSKDKSMGIVNEIIKKNDNNTSIHVLDKKNGGVSSARNAGLGIASGEYVIMVDADDIVSPNFLSSFVKMMEEKPNCNIYSSNFLVCFDMESESFGYETIDTISLSWEQAQIAFYNRTIKFLLPTLMLRKVFLDQNHIRFDELVSYSEDVQFIWRCLAYNRVEVIHSNAVLYHYILHSGSTMTSSGLAKIKTGIEGLDRLFHETKDQYCEEIKDLIVSNQVFSLLHGASRMLDKKTFSKLFDEANCKSYIKRQAMNGSIKVKIVSMILLGSRSAGYEIMKRF